jgi:hypothetical protein
VRWVVHGIRRVHVVVVDVVVARVERRHVGVRVVAQGADGGALRVALLRRERGPLLGRQRGWGADIVLGTEAVVYGERSQVVRVQRGRGLLPESISRISFRRN